VNASHRIRILGRPNVTHRPAASSRLRFVRPFGRRLRLHRPAVAVALVLLLGMGCTAVREPLTVIEPDYSYHNDPSADAQTLSRLYTVPIEGKDTVAAAGRLDIAID